MKNWIILISLLFILSACTKTEGTGGAATVKGTVIVEDYNSFGTLLSTYPAQDQKVFIIYGADDNIVEDDVSTSYDGTFEFEFLRKGTYTAFVYSDCRTCDSGDSAVKVTFEIDAKKDVIDLSKIIIYKY
jgi:hypothetical protein